jgi:hypothetical protein
MEAKQVKDLMEAYASVYNDLDEEMTTSHDFRPGERKAPPAPQLPKPTPTGTRKPTPTGTRKPSPTPPRKPIGGPQMPGWKPMKDDVDLFDIIKGHLLDEGYADTNEAALAIMANMSEEWKQSILSEDPVQDLRDRELAAGQKGSERSHAASGGNGGVKKTSKKSPSVGTGPQNNFGRGF